MGKAISWCPRCNNKIKLSPMKCTQQICPYCGKPLRAYFTCDYAECDCEKCKEEDKQ